MSQFSFPNGDTLFIGGPRMRAIKALCPVGTILFEESETFERTPAGWEQVALWYAHETVNRFYHAKLARERRAAVARAALGVSNTLEARATMR